MTVLKILFVRLRFVFIFIIIGAIVANWDYIMNVVDKITRPKSSEAAVSGEFEWFCPMHPSVVRGDASQNCPICGMPLSKRKKGEKAQLPAGVISRLQLSPFRIKQAGVATSEIQYRTLVREVRTVGFIEYSEKRLTHITARIAGRIDRLFVDYTGAKVKKGDPVVWIYSPDLVTTQEEYLLTLKGLEGAGTDPDAVERARRLVQSARERLFLWGISDEQIKRLEETRKAQTHLQIFAPADGTVLKREIATGNYVNEGQEMYLLADLSIVWMQAEIFERDIGIVKEGQIVEITSEAFPGVSFPGTVSFVSPTVQPETRTARVRVEVSNSDETLKPGMYVTAKFRIPLGNRGVVYYGCCEACPEIRSDVAGKCPKCGMELIKMVGQTVAPPTPAEKSEEKIIYVCPMHPEQVFDKPGTCDKCNGMNLMERKIPVGGKLVFTCPMHPEVQMDKPGKCPKCSMNLQFKIISEGALPTEMWVCPLHPERTSDNKAKCPDCGNEMKRMEFEQVLAVPVSAVIDTGFRKIVFLDKGFGTFDSVEIVAGPAAGDYYPVLKGLAVGDRVVTAGAFLLDAEARLNPAAGSTYFGASGGETKK